MRRRRLAGWIVAFAAFLFVLAVAALVIGIHDAALARAALGVAVSSAVLLIIGLSFLIAAFQLLQLSRRHTWPHGVRPPCKPPVVVAFLAMILVGIYLLLTTAKTGSDQRPVVIAVALVLIGVSLGGLHFFGRDARVTLARVGTIALGLVGTTIGAWEFWYQTQYVPFHAGSDVTMTANLTPLTQRQNYDVVRAAVNLEDIGGGGVSVLGSTYTLTGSQLIPCPRPSTAHVVGQVFEHVVLDPQRSRYMADVWEIQPSAVLAAGKFVRDGKRLDASVPATRSFVFFVPRHAYQLLRFRAQLFAIPASIQLSQRTLPEFHPLPGDNALYGLWHVEDDSWLHDLVSGRERWVVLRYELVDPNHPSNTQTSPDLRVTARFPHPTWTKRPPSPRQMQALFASSATTEASEPFADAELPLASVGKAGAGGHVPAACSSPSSHG